MFKHWKIILFSTGMTLYILGLFTNVVADPDLWGYLAFGRLFWESKHFPYHDVFSYIPTKELWVYHEWLTGVIFYPVYKWTGETGLQLLRYAIILMTVGLVFFTAEKRGSKPIPTIIILFLTVNALTYGYSPVRAQVFTYLFFSLSIYILERCKKEQTFTLLWWLLPVHLIWCNVHGGFLAGLGIICLYAIGEGLTGNRFLPYVRILIFSALVTLINPYGVYYWIYMFQAVGMPRPDILEWMSIPMALTAGKYFGPGILFIAIFLISFLLMIRYQKRSATDILVLIVTAYLGFKHIRHSILFFLIFGVYMPVVFSDFLHTLGHDIEKMKRPPWLLKSLSTALILVFTFLIGSSFSKFIVSSSFDLRVPSPYYPAGAMEWIKNHHWKGNVLPNFDWGEFIIWECYPDCRVAMDGRFETVYKEDDHREYFDFLMGRNDWGRFLNKYPHGMVLIRSSSKTDALMRSHPDWQLVYEDTGCSLFLPKMKGSAR
ncbi:MAG: hypothetical protein NTZ24_14660 [Deltaproteobacteria bacterium]|nr:hypothetical protein [Deltaproteobacteria bacterium]